MAKIQVSNGSVVVVAAMIFMVAVAMQNHHVAAQSADCAATAELLSPCASAVGNNPQDPTPECCAVLQTADVDCICALVESTIKLPSECGLDTPQCPSD
uniref:prMALE1 n=1 Tax=Pinus radiata TaxID=3347 RepID=Q9ZTS3_PINRA|nr:PrMALE1 [Pinus radiata]